MLALSPTVPAVFLTPEGSTLLIVSLVLLAAPCTRGVTSSTTFPTAAVNSPGVNNHPFLLRPHPTPHPLSQSRSERRVQS